MYGYEQKHRFIELRAAGHSYASISATLGIGKGTCIDWNKELEAEIQKTKADQLQELQTAFGMAKEARIKRLGASLSKIDEALEKVDLTTADPIKLLEIKLKYAEALKDEYVAPQPTATELNTSEDCQKALAKLLARVQSGELTEQQAAKELAIIAKIHDTFVTARLKDQLEALNAMLPN